MPVGEEAGAGVRFRAWTGIAVLAAAWATACERDHAFHTVAVYEALRGRYVVRIEARGVVRAGDDLARESRGVLTVSTSGAFGSAGGPPGILELALEGGRMRLAGPGSTGEGEADGAAAVSRLLADGGYPVEPAEVDEVVSAAEGVLLGPKATPMSGQTRLLGVLSIDFDRRGRP
jgi:hypothetical protein